VGMVALAAIFSRGNPVAIAVPPIAAAATSIFVIKTDENQKQLPAQAERMQRIETRLETLETILTAGDYERLTEQNRLMHPSELTDRT
jgi:hypothetical protein